MFYKEIDNFKKNYIGLDLRFVEQGAKRLDKLANEYEEFQNKCDELPYNIEPVSYYSALNAVTAFAVKMSQESDRLIDNFVEYGEPRTPFWRMAKFEQDLRSFLKGDMAVQEKINFRQRLRNAKSSYLKLGDSLCSANRVGTIMLYPAMAIVHGFDIFGVDSNDFGVMMEDFYSKKVDVLDFPAPKTMDEVIEDVKPIEKNVDVDNILRSVANEGKLLVKQDEQSDKVNDMVLEDSISNQDIIWARNSKAVVTEQVEVKKEETNTKATTKVEEKKQNKVALEETQEYLNYANYVFANSKDFSNVELNKFSYTTTQTIMGKVCGAQEIVPFVNAKTIEQIKEVYNNLDDNLKVVFMQVIYQDAVKASLSRDISAYLSLDENVQEMVKGLCKQDDNYKTMLEMKMHYSNKRNNAIRKMVRLSKRDDDYYGLASTRK